jgi:hypothetical protein
MTNVMNDTVQHSVDILLAELMADDEFCRAFLRDPDRTLKMASEWGVPLSDSELQSLCGPAHRVWELVADEFETRLAMAA